MGRDAHVPLETQQKVLDHRRGSILHVNTILKSYHVPGKHMYLQARRPSVQRLKAAGGLEGCSSISPGDTPRASLAESCPLTRSQVDRLPIYAIGSPNLQALMRVLSDLGCEPGGSRLAVFTDITEEITIFIKVMGMAAKQIHGL